ncbi:MAG: hypothetical protein GY906_30055 [bacterium]|nr:hypothetical protein [bacterium]
MFHFVDQILESKPGISAIGLKHVTKNDVFVHSTSSHCRSLMSCIIGEALGQLGAWNIMAANDFTLRPLAGVVGEVAIFGEATVGKTIRLETTIDSVDDEAVYYHAIATVDGEKVLSLSDTLGPLVPLNDFNDPHELRERWDRIRGTSDPEVITAGEPSRAVDLSFDRILSLEIGSEITAAKLISGEDAFFNDHFPRKPVLPLSLLLESVLQLGQRLWSDDAARFTPTRACKVKMRRFVEPGQTVTAKLKVKERDKETAQLAFVCEADGRRVCTGEAEFGAAEE